MRTNTGGSAEFAETYMQTEPVPAATADRYQVVVHVTVETSRRALRFRDKGCRFPGCTHTRFIDGHHIRHWADGGETMDWDLAVGHLFPYHERPH
ncbi:MAG: HNH endonuclease signature motif containing protein [Woeseiaceae bacterium]